MPLAFAPKLELPGAIFSLSLFTRKDFRNKYKNPVFLISLKIGTELAVLILIKDRNSSAINTFSLAELSRI